MSVSTSARNRANRAKGHEAERNVARYLRANGFPHAERAVRTGYTTPGHSLADPLDVTGIPGLVWSVKNDQRNEIPAWLAEAETARVNAGADLAILVSRRRGKASPSRWWAWVALERLVPAVLGTGEHDLEGYACLELGDLVPLLHRAGYGDEIDDSDLEPDDEGEGTT